MYFPKPTQMDDNISSVSDLTERSATFVSKSQRYAVDLSNHIAVCEMNYRKFLKLLPGLRNGTNKWAFSAGASVKKQHKSSYFDVNITVIDAAPYTTTLSVEQEHGVLSTPKIIVRLYHDADLAEIISWDGHRNWHPQYKYPNINMYQPDEKVALNRFLTDWLAFCQAYGFVTAEKCDQIRFCAK